jgi:hypothetical protein
MSIPFSFTESSIGGLERVYGDDDDDDGGGDDDGGRGDDDGGRGDDDGGRGDDDGGRGDDDDGERSSRSFRFNDDDRNLRRLLESLLQQDRDDDSDNNKQEPNVEPKSYEGYGLKDEGDNRNIEFNFAVASDFGCSENARNTIKNMEDKKPELVLPLGDLSVDKTANCWLDLISTFDDKSEITFGYHDVKDGESKLNQYKDAFGLDNLYYSFDYRHVHFLIMSALSDFNVTSDQYKFIEKDLKTASENQNIDWIVVTSYGPFYTSPSAHPAKNDIRNIYHPLFDTYGVDLVLQGHNHNYQRTYPVTFNADKKSNPTVTNAFTTGYGNNDGVIYAIVGTGGEGFHPLEGRHSYVATQFADKFGFLDIEISNGNPHTNLTGTFYDNQGSIIHDHFTRFRMKF